MSTATPVDDTLALVAQAAADFARPDAQRARRVRDTLQGCDPAVWSQMADMGWLAMLLPDELDGSGLGLRAAAAVARRLGYACHGEPFVPVAVLAASALLGCPVTPLRDRLLRSLAGGERLVTLAWQSPRGELALDAAGVTAVPGTGGPTLDGSLRFVAAPQARDLVVAVRLQGQLLLAAVDAGTPGIRVQPEPQADRSALGWVHFSTVPVPDAAVLARGAAAEAVLADAVEAGIVATAAELLGLIERMLETTQAYLGVRKQFGQAIGSFQVLQHRLVDLWIQQALTRAALDTALDTLADPDATLTQRRAAASSAKARASQAALQVAGQCVQLHGAIGISDEYELGVYVNRSLALAAWLGNALAHQRRYAELVPVQDR